MERIPFPEIKIISLEDARRLAMNGLHFVFDQFRSEGLSDHGSGPALDRELYDQPSLLEPRNRWDSEGTYYDGNTTRSA